MINVNIIDVKELAKYGLILRHDKNILTIQNEEHRTLVEIIYSEDTGQILISAETAYRWAFDVKDIYFCEKFSCICIDYSSEIFISSSGYRKYKQDTFISKVGVV